MTEKKAYTFSGKIDYHTRGHYGECYLVKTDNQGSFAILQHNCPDEDWWNLKLGVKVKFNATEGRTITEFARYRQFKSGNAP